MIPPMSSPVSNPIDTPATTAVAFAAPESISFCMTRAQVTPERVRTAPAERSIPSLREHDVAPKARINNIEFC